MNLSRFSKKLIARKLREQADRLDPPGNQARRVESRVEKMLAHANAESFSAEEATRIISRVAKKTPRLLVVLYNHYCIELVDAKIRNICERTSNN